MNAPRNRSHTLRGPVAATALTWIMSGKPDVAMAGNGLLAGLVGITAGTAHVSNWGAVIIGLIAGLIVVGAVFFFDRIKIDDPVGAVSVHGVCGAFGTLAVGVTRVARRGGAAAPAPGSPAWTRPGRGR